MSDRRVKIRFTQVRTREVWLTLPKDWNDEVALLNAQNIFDDETGDRFNLKDCKTVVTNDGEVVK